MLLRLNQQLVEKCTDILRLYCAQNEELRFGVNEIFRKLGDKNKPKIVGCIKELEKAKIFRTEKERKKPNKKLVQKEYKVLTDLGKSIRDFMVGIELSHKAYSEINEKINRLNIPLDRRENAKEELAKLNKLMDDKGIISFSSSDDYIVDATKYYDKFKKLCDQEGFDIKQIKGDFSLSIIGLLGSLFDALDEYSSNIINCLIYGYYQITDNILFDEIPGSVSKNLVEEILQKIIFDEIKQKLLKGKLREIELPKQDKDYLRFIEIAEPLRIHMSSKLYHEADYSHIHSEVATWNHKETEDMDFALRLISGERNKD